MIDIQNIVQNYEKASEGMQSASEDYKYAHNWINYSRDNRSKIINDIINFRTSVIGCDDSAGSNDLSWGVLVELVQKCGQDFIRELLPKFNIGNAKTSFDLNGVNLDPALFTFIDWTYDIETYRRFLGIQGFSIICEIGGGFGGMSCCLKQVFNSKILSIDLPETNALFEYYIRSRFPKIRIFNYSDYIRSSNDLITADIFSDHDVIILPHYLVEKISMEGRIDLFVNTRSMMEMSPVMISKYFKFIHSAIKEEGLFFNANRYEKYENKIGNYPYDSRWRVVNSCVSKEQPWNHLLLTQRTSHEQEDLKKELKALGSMEYLFVAGVNHSDKQLYLDPVRRTNNPVLHCDLVRWIAGQELSPTVDTSVAVFFKCPYTQKLKCVYEIKSERYGDKIFSTPSCAGVLNDTRFDDFEILIDPNLLHR